MKMAQARTLWGSVDKNGNILSGSEDFSVANVGAGRYKITFNRGFAVLPAILATQNNFGSGDEYNTDGVAVPFVDKNSCQVNTGGGSPDSLQNRSFAFMAIGF
jgi:hypothetical protein